MNASTNVSGTPLPRKLGIRSGATVALVDAPEGFESVLEGLPEGVTLRRALRGRFDVILAFFVDARRLEQRLPTLRGALTPGGGLWIAWPKRSSGVATELGEGDVRRLGLGAGLVDNKVCAIDAVWSGLRFVYRLADRP